MRRNRFPPPTRASRILAPVFFGFVIAALATGALLAVMWLVSFIPS